MLPTPEDVVVSMCEEACASKVLRSKHAKRFLPITHSCFASVDSMKALAPKVLKKHFPEGQWTEQAEGLLMVTRSSSKGLCARFAKESPREAAMFAGRCFMAFSLVRFSKT